MGYTQSVETLQLRVSYDDAESLAAEFESNLRHGRAFIACDAQIEVLSECTLILEHPTDGTTLELSAQVVMIGAGGIGIELRPADDEVIARISAFAATPGITDDASGTSDASDADEEAIDAESEVESAAVARASQRPSQMPSQRPPRLSSIPPEVQSVSRQQVLRNMPMAGQLKIARSGDLSDRVMLERMLGKAVWEALLLNAKLTVPEVAKIARKGTVPKKLLDLIVENAPWARAALVRRALLGNPRVSKDAIHKLLVLTPKPELKLILKSTAYSHAVREAARRLFQG